MRPLDARAKTLGVQPAGWQADAGLGDFDAAGDLGLVAAEGDGNDARRLVPSSPASQAERYFIVVARGCCIQHLQYRKPRASRGESLVL